MVQIGAVLGGKYRIDRVLGQGGMGVVVQAMHLQLGQPVALKFLLPEILNNGQIVQRFLREAQAAVRLRSEHVARVIDVGTFDDGAPYMVLEYLDGTDLAHFPRQNLTIGIIVDMMLQACEALADAHALGIVHRDIKPGNFFITTRTDGSLLLKILDFGISKLSTAHDASLTATQTVMGTPAYMSPEQMKSARNVDNRSDIWALGIVLYELLQGTPPYEAETFSALIIKVATEALPPLRVQLPAGLAEIVYRCLEKDVTRRFQNVAELAQALSPYAQSTVQAAVSVERTSRVLGTWPPITASGKSPSTITASTGAITTSPGGGKKWPIFAAAGAVLGGIVVIAVLAGGGGGGDNNGTQPGAPPKGGEPAKPEPAKDVAKPDPAKPDPAKPDPAKPDPAKPDPAKDVAKPDPAKDVAKPDPAKDVAAKPDPAKDTAKPDPAKDVAKTTPKPPRTTKPPTSTTKPPTSTTKPPPGPGSDDDVLGRRN